MNIIARDAGRLSLRGVDPARGRAVLRGVGSLPEGRGRYRELQAIAVRIFFACLAGLLAGHARRGGEQALRRMGRAQWRDAKVETLAKGMQQKVQFITTVLHKPEVLILDEPHSGLDPVNQQVLRDTILDAARQGRTVIFSTHNMDQAEQLCEYVCIIAGGQKVLDGRLRDLRRANRGNRYLIEFDEASAAADRFIQGNRRLLRKTQRGAELWEVELPAGDEPGELLAELARLPVPLHRFE